MRRLGDFHFRDGRFADAAAAYARACTCAPGDASLHFVLADAVFATGDYHFAAYLIGEAVRLDPAIANAETDKRLQYGDVKLFEQQMQTLMRYVQEEPYDVMALLVLGYNLKFSGKPQDAAKAFARVLEIDPASVAARRFADSLAPKPQAAGPAAAGRSAQVRQAGRQAVAAQRRRRHLRDARTAAGARSKETARPPTMAGGAEAADRCPRAEQNAGHCPHGGGPSQLLRVTAGADDGVRGRRDAPGHRPAVIPQSHVHGRGRAATSGVGNGNVPVFASRGPLTRCTADLTIALAFCLRARADRP